MRNKLFLFALLLVTVSCQNSYFEIHDAHFFYHGEPQYFIGISGRTADSTTSVVRIGIDQIADLNDKNAIVVLDAQDTTILKSVKKYSRNKKIIAWEIENGADRINKTIASLRETDPHHIIGVVIDDVIRNNSDDYINKVYECVLESDMDYLCFHTGNLDKYQEQISYVQKMQKPCIYIVDEENASTAVLPDLLASARSGGLFGGCIVDDVSSCIETVHELDTCCTRYVAFTKKLLQEREGDLRIEVCFRNQDPQQVVNLVLLSDTTLLKEVKDTVRFISGRFKDGIGTFNLGRLASGFYQVNIDGMEPFNIGVCPERIVSPQDKPGDFDEFWSETLMELAEVPLEASITLVPEHSNELRNTYEVELKSFGGETMGGILTEPVKEGRYPVVIEYMGYGATPYYRHPSANPDRLEFMVSVRNQGIFKEGHEKWVCRGIHSKETFYYRGAYCDVVRALDYVCSLPKADTSRIYIWGESQGGAFTWISASLDHRAKAIAPSVPFMGDFPDYQNIVRWPVNQIMAAADSAGIPHQQINDMLRYFDVKNFADRVTCPVYMAFGLQDVTCPPHTNFAPYNISTAPKQYMCIPQTGHAVWSHREWSDAKEKFFFNQ